MASLQAYSRTVENQAYNNRIIAVDETKTRAGFSTGGLASFARENANAARAAAASAPAPSPAPRARPANGAGRQVDISA